MQPRSQAVQTAQIKEFDVAVIGGGVVGAGIAQDAASRGLSVILLEKRDFASGTSSKTTKLIHGGLRYLEQLHFGLTRQLLHERALLEKLAPHMVRDFSFVLPILKKKRFFGFKAELGLSLYDFLGMDVIKDHRHTRLSQREVLETAPGLSREQIVGGLRFHDCITDDARLVMEVVKAACRQGATAVNYVEVTGFRVEEGKLVAIKCHDCYAGGDMEVRARAYINAAGIWSDKLMQMLDPAWQPRCSPAKGIHIMVPQSAFETNSALFLPTNDGRYVFVVPWQRAVMIGTTDTSYSGDNDNPLANVDEVDYLISVVNAYAGASRITRDDVIASWAGLRPLVGSPPSESGKATGSVSREHLIYVGPYKVVGLLGGKLTNYRIMADEVLSKVFANHPELATIAKSSRTPQIMLGGFFDRQDFLSSTAHISARARGLSLEPATIDHLIASYGKDADQILTIVENEPELAARVCPDFPPIMAEIPFCIVNESAMLLEDLLFRRMRMGLVHQVQCLEAIPRVARLVRSCLGWDDERTQIEIETTESIINEHIASSHTFQKRELQRL
ncbi:MAG: glycerol-3-phosphate dehydrogenase/oxidase [Candidatus Melainabacteria bacterium]|nr:glycerol-3-phosphate dehydrogenase/oxidase [Candidatus Melainabacteria bacterium]